MVRHKWLVGLSGALLAVGLFVLGWYVIDQWATLKIAVGPQGSEDVRFVQNLAEYVKRERGLTRLQVVITNGPAESGSALEKGRADLAIVRSDLGMSASGLAVAILSRSVLLLVAPPPAGETAEERTKIATVADLSGRRVGAITNEGNRLLDIVLKHYGMSADQLQVIPTPVDDLRAAFTNKQIDAALIVGPATSELVAEAVAAASNSEDELTFLPIHGKAIEQRNPTYQSIEIAAGLFGGSPPKPAESITTVGFTTYLVARQTLSDSRVANFSKLLYGARQTLAAEFPGTFKVEAPSTDKDAVPVLHQGTAEYLDDSLKTFFDRYGDAIFYAMIFIPFFGSAIAGLASFFKTDTRRRRTRLLNRLLALIHQARQSETLAELEALQAEIDKILTMAVRHADADEAVFATRSFALALDQARLAVADRRGVLVALPSGARAGSNLDA